MSPTVQIALVAAALVLATLAVGLLLLARRRPQASPAGAVPLALLPLGALLPPPRMAAPFPFGPTLSGPALPAPLPLGRMLPLPDRGAA